MNWRIIKVANEWHDSNHIKCNAFDIPGCYHETKCKPWTHNGGYKWIDTLRNRMIASNVWVSTSMINYDSKISKFISKDYKIRSYNAFLLLDLMNNSMVWHVCSSQSIYKMKVKSKRGHQALYQPSVYVSRMKTIATEMFDAVFWKTCSHIKINHMSHDDVIKWKHFPCYWPFVTGEFPAQWPVTRSFDVFTDAYMRH